MRRRLQNNRVLAGFLAAVTAFSPVVSSIPVYAADVGSDGITVDSGSEGSVSVSEDSGIVLSSDYADGSASILIDDEAEDPAVLTLKPVGVHGEMVVRKAIDGGTEEQHVRLSVSDGKHVITVRNGSGKVVSQTSYADPAKAVLTVSCESGSEVTVDAVADDGYDVSKYSVSIDGGTVDVNGDGSILVEENPEEELTNFKKDTYVSFGYGLTLDRNKTVEADFEDLSNIQVSKEGNVNGYDEADDGKGSGITVADSDQVERQVVDEKDADIMDSKSEDGHDDEEAEAESDAFVSSDDVSVKDYSVKDFSSARLVVVADDKGVFVDPENIIGTYDNLYLLQYQTPGQARNAYVYYLDLVDAIEPDVSVGAADDKKDGSTAKIEPMTEDENPVTAASLADGVSADKSERLIALVDSGVTDDVEVSDRVSVLDERLYSNHPHGTEMAQAIYGVNPDAQILSIRALDDSGDGTISSITAAVKYAIVHHADIINLSLCARKTLATSVLEQVIGEALSENIKVAGAAGNYGRDASGYVPGFVQDAYIIGACDENGDRIGISNYGVTVDYNVVAQSTSEATARFSGYLSLYGDVRSEDVNGGILYQPDYDSSHADGTGEGSEDDYGSGSVLNGGSVMAILDANEDYEESAKKIYEDGSVNVEDPVTYHFDILESYVPYFSAQAVSTMPSGLSLEMGNKWYYGCGASTKTQGQYWSSNDFTSLVDGGVDADKRLVFCLNPAADTPSSGRYTMQTIPNSDPRAKAIYRFQQQNNWTGVSGGYNINTSDGKGALHVLLAKLSGDSQWNKGVYNDSGLMNAVAQMESIVSRASTPPGINSASVTPSRLKASVDGSIQRTGTFTVNGGGISFDVQSGATLVNVSNNNSRHTGHVTLSAGTKFYFEAPVDQVQKVGQKEWPIICTGTGFGYVYYRIFTSSRLQDLMGHFDMKSSDTKFYVEWVDVGFVRINKQRDRGTESTARAQGLGYEQDGSLFLDHSVDDDTVVFESEGNMRPILHKATLDSPAYIEYVDEDGFEAQKDIGGTVVGDTRSQVGDVRQSISIAPPANRGKFRINVTDASGNVVHSWVEGYLGFQPPAGANYQLWGFCGDVSAHYTNSTKTAKDAVAVYGEDKCKEICAMLEWVDTHFIATGCFEPCDIYAFWQVCVWSVVNESTYPGCTYRYGDGITDQSGHNVGAHMSELMNEGRAWAKANKDSIQLGTCLYWDDGSSQPLTTWSYEYNPNGYLQIQKFRQQGATACDINYLLGGEAIYNRAGAQYKITAADGTDYGTLTTDANGNTSISAPLPAGTYTVTEIKAPKNYILGTDASRVKTVTVSAANTQTNPAVVTFYNRIEGDPIDLAMFKHQNGTAGNKLNDAWIGPQGDSNWADARFRLYYFNTEDRLTLSQMQARVDAGAYVEAWDWKMADLKYGPYHVGMTNFLRDNYLGNVKGVTDPAFSAVTTQVQFPIGTYLLVETKAPRGFELPDIRFGFQIYQINGNAGNNEISNDTRFLDASFDSGWQPGDRLVEHNIGMVIPPSSVDENSRVIMIAEDHDRYGLKIQKGDGNDRSKTAQGDSNWSGIHFSVTNASENPVVIDGQTFNPGQVISNVSMVTDANGYAQIPAVLPQGTYEVREISRNTDKSYYLTDRRVFTYTLHDSDDGTKYHDGDVMWPDNYTASNGAIADHVLNVPVCAGLQFSKIDFMLDNNNPHGDTDLSGAQYAVINASDAYILAKQNKNDKHSSAKHYLADAAGAAFTPTDNTSIENGFGNASTMYAKLKSLVDKNDGSVIKICTTDAKGQFSLPNDYLPYGTYYVIETKAPTGYHLNSDWVGKVVVRDSNKSTIIKVTSVYDSSMNASKGKHEQPEQIFRGGISAVKFDLMRDDVRDHGDANLGSAEFTIINASEHAAMNKDGRVIPTSGLTDATVSYAKLQAASSKYAMQVIRTDGSGVAKTGSRDLPYGTYYVYESKVPVGYFMNPNWCGKVVVREDGRIYNVETKADKNHDTYNHEYYKKIGHTPVITPGDDYAVRDQIFRSGINIQKVDKEMGKQTPQGESVLYGAEFTILNASNTSIRNRDRLDIDTCKARVGSHPDYATLRAIADEGSCTVEVLSTNSEGFTTGKVTDLPYGTYYVIETKASYGYHIDTTFIGKAVIRDDGLMLSLGETKKNSSFIDINDTSEKYVQEQQRRGNLFMLKVNIDGEYKPYIPFLISAVRVEADGSETVLESHVMVTDEYGRLDTRRKPRDPSTINGMDQYVKEKTITAEGEKHLREAAEWGVWFQGNSDDSPKTGVNDTFGALYTCHYRITELHCRDNADLEENLLASELIYVYNDRCEQDEVMSDDNDDLVIYHPLVDTEIQMRSEALDTESETKSVPVREAVEVQDFVEFNHVSADHRYRMETKFLDLTDGRKPIKIQGTTDDQAELSEDHLWVTKEFTPKKQSGTNNTYDDVTMYATLDTTGLMGHKIMAVDYLYQYIDVTSKDDVVGDWVLVARHPHDSEIVEDECLYVPDLHTYAKDGGTDTRVGVKSGSSTIYDTVDYENLSRNEQYVIRMTVKDAKTGEYAVTDANGDPVYVVSDPIFKRKETPVGGSITMPKLELDSSKFTDGTTLTVIEELFRTDEDGKPMGEPILVHDSLLDEDQTIRYIDMDSLAWDIRTKDDVGKVESVATITDRIALNNVVFENNGKGQYTYEVRGRLVHQKPYSDVNGKVFQAGDEADLLDGSQTVATITSDADGVAEIRYADGAIANGKVTIKSYGMGVSHLVYPERVGDNSYVTDYDKAVADVEVELIYKVDSTLLEDATLVSYATLHHNAALSGFTDDSSKGILEQIGELFGKEDEIPAVSRHEELLDPDQTVHYPSIRTSALDNSTKDDVGAVRDDAVLTDTVTLRNLIPGHEYVVSGKLMNQQTGKPYISNGAEVTKKAHIIVTEDGKITAPNGERTETTDYDEGLNEVDGTVDLVFRFNAVGLEDTTLVVFEDLIHNGVTVTTHADIEDKGQSVHFPKIRTTNNDGYTKDHVATWSDKAVIVDTVKYSNLVPGRTYTLNGTLMNKDTGEKLLDKDLNPVHATRTFVAGEEGEGLTVTELDEKLNRVSGTVDIVFEFDATLLEGKTAVAFEELVHNKITVTTHEDMQDEEQTVHFPKVRTSAIDYNTTDEVGVTDKTTITDTVRLWNLIPGQTYTVNGVLMDKDTKEPLLVDGKEVRQSAVVRVLENGKVDTSVSNECICGNPKYCGCGNGSVRITSWNFDMRSVDAFVNLAFDLDASDLKGATVVVFEDLVHNGVTVAHHTDIDDLAQTIHFPRIRTTATDVDTGDHAGTVTDTARIEDVVKYENLVIGKTYTLRGTLMDQNTGYPVMGKDGRPVMTEATFDVTKDGGGANKVTSFDEDNQTVSGTYTLVFELDSSLLAGHTVVVFEELYHNDVKVTTHTDIDDDKQSVHYPEIRTMARDESTGDHVGTLWGSMINSVRQLFGEKDADGNGIPDNKQQNIIDTVSLTNLVPGYTYVVSGILMDVDESHEAGEPVPLTVDGKEIVQAVTITVSEDGKSIKAWDGSKTTVTRTDDERQSVDGTVELVYTLDSSRVSGKKTVVFEDLYHDHTYDRDTKPTEVVPEDLIHKHRDINDEDQSVSEVSIHTTALDDVTETHVGVVPDNTNGNLTIIRDEVNLAKLVPGMEYRIEGALVDITASDFENGKVVYIKPDGESTENRDEAVRQTETFVAEDENETHTLKFGICGDRVQGKSVTVFEDLYHNDVKIAMHPMTDENGKVVPEDFASQTVYYPTGKTNATDNVTGTHTSYAGGTRKVTDRVYFENLLVGDTYEIRGQLRYQSDFVDADGNAHAAGDLLEGAEVSVKFKAAEDLTKVMVVGGDEDAKVDSLTVTELPNGQKVISGYVGLVFTVDASKLAGATLVAFETFYQNDVPLFVHDDLSDYPQTVRIPKIWTNAKSEDLDEASVYDENGGYRDITITDTVSYQNLWTKSELEQLHEDGKYVQYQDGTFRDTEGNVIYDINEIGTYILKGVLMDKETGEPVTDKDGKDYTVISDPFTPESGTGTHDVTFTINGADLVKDGICTLEGKTLVVFEDLYQTDQPDAIGEGTLVGTHHDIEDTDQSVRFPKVRTHAVDGELDSEAESVHEDDAYTSIHESLSGEITVTDRVSFENLHGGTVYEISGVLQKVTKFDENGVPVEYEPALDKDGNPITADLELDTSEFSKDYHASVSGTADLVFRFDGTDFGGETFVVFESLSRGGVLVGIHADITDEAQTVYVPRIGTKLGEVLTGMQEILADKTVLVDTVAYENLEAGKTYALHARLMDRTDGSEITGTEVIGTFVAGRDDQVIFADGTKTLTEEELRRMAKDGEITVQELPAKESDEDTGADHVNDIQVDDEISDVMDLPSLEIKTDIDHIPDVGSSDSDGAADDEAVSEDGTDAGGMTEDEKAEADRQMKQKEIAGRIAELFRNAVESGGDEPSKDVVPDEVKPDGSDVSEDGVIIGSDESLEGGDVSGDASEAADTRRVDGSVKVVLPVDARTLAGTTVVAFETLYAPAEDDEAKIVAIHEDIEDADQSVSVPKIQTSARIDGEKSVVATNRMIVTDTVNYRNLVPGQKYTMHGLLMDKATGESTEVVAEAEFTPEWENGWMEMTFVFDGTQLAGRSLVVFETLTCEGPDGEDVVVAEHKDIEDMAQTVTIEEPEPDVPVEVIDTGERQMTAVLIGAVCLFALLAAAYFGRKRRMHG